MFQYGDAIDHKEFSAHKLMRAPCLKIHMHVHRGVRAARNLGYRSHEEFSGESKLPFQTLHYRQWKMEQLYTATATRVMYLQMPMLHCLKFSWILISKHYPVTLRRDSLCLGTGQYRNCMLSMCTKSVLGQFDWNLWYTIDSERWSSCTPAQPLLPETRVWYERS